MKRFDPSVGSSLLTLGVIAAVGILLSLVTVVPSGNGTVAAGARADGDDILASGDPGAVASGDGQGANGGGGTTGSGGPASGGGSAGRGGQAGAATGCDAARNGGNTDTGVTANSVKLAATIVADGPGSSFLGPVRTGMMAVVNKVNSQNGVCGRKLNLILRNDSWDAVRGAQFIENFVSGEKVFALAVVPSSEGLQKADAFIKNSKVPVVGTDGMLIHQYLNPWIWPVASSTISAMHVMAKNAHDRGARHFGIVFDAKYHFGVEGAFAFNQSVKRLTGSDIPGFDPSLKKCERRFCGIQPQKPSYASEAEKFDQACFHDTSIGANCDFIAYLLEPDTAVSFFREGRDANPAVGFAGAQPLFNRDFAENCKSSCDGMWVWTGYNPPLGALEGTPGVSRFVNDVRRESASADVTNQFLEGGYLGMSLLVEALQKVGPNLTRNNLRSVLDSMTFDAGLSSPLSWKPGNHFANTSVQAFEIRYGQTFDGFRQKTGFLSDPWVGQDIPG